MSKVADRPHRLTIIFSIASIAIALTGLSLNALKSFGGSRSAPSSQKLLPKGAGKNILLNSGSKKLECDATIDASLVVPFADRYYLAVICGVADEKIDKYADEQITVSDPIFIRSESLHLVTRLTSATVDHANLFYDTHDSGHMIGNMLGLMDLLPKAVIVWYEPVLVPKGTPTSKIHRLSDVTTLGGIVVKEL